MNNTYLLMAVLVATTMTIGFAYAERSVVEVPFDFTGNSCTFDQELVIYTCKWEGSSETIPSDKSDSGIVPPEQILEESKEAHDLAVALEETVKLTPTERKIKKLLEEVEDGTISFADKTLLKALEDMNRICTLGIEHGALIQKYATFEIPTITPDTLYKSINLDSNNALSKILQKTMECEMWDEYRVSHLGQRYLDIIVDDSTSQGHHRDRVATMETFPSQVLTPEIFKQTLTTAETYICESSHFDYGYKKSTGCFEKLDLAESDGIPVNTPQYKRYLEYLSTGFVPLETLKKQEEERIIQETIDSFASRMGIDADALKALVHNEGIDEYNEANKP